ncbi:hypothetical protein [Nocardia heshunensis]
MIEAACRQFHGQMSYPRPLTYPRNLGIDSPDQPSIRGATARGAMIPVARTGHNREPGCAARRKINGQRWSKPGE